jgi:hypothetical protein
VDCGVNCTLNVADEFAAIVAGVVSPLMPNPAPEIVAALMERFVLPLLVMVTFCVLVCPTVTLLKLSDVGEKTGTGSAPFPPSGTVKVELLASLVIVKAPVADAVDVGAN